MDEAVVDKVAAKLNDREWLDELAQDTLEEMEELEELAKRADQGERIEDPEDPLREEHEGDDYDDDYSQYGGRGKGVGPMLCLAAVTVVAAAFA